MCGIVGRLGFRESSGAVRAVLERQLAALHHRGPDACGVYVGDGVALGHTRLAIIDLAGGNQPMHSADGRYTVTFNGEIYNYIELRAELQRHGCLFRTASDTEVLLHGYRVWGAGLLEKLNGMFAFALYDSAERVLFCARDPFGQKPFYYLMQGGELHFASETRALLLVPGFAGTVDPASIEHFLVFESFYFDRSIYAGIKKLAPGHCLVFEAGSLSVRPYYDSLPREHPSATLSESVERVDEALRRAVTLTCRADVPVALLLSGGLDSSLILAYMRRNLPDHPIAAFHLNVLEPTYDESRFAEAAARSLGVSLTKVPFELRRLREVAFELFPRLDEPQADPGILPKYFVCKEIARTHKVVLGGDGGDELFYGYLLLQAQRIAHYYRRVPRLLHEGLLKPAVLRLPSATGYMRLDFLAKQFVRGFPADESTRALNWMHFFADYPRHRLFSPGFSACGAGVDEGRALLRDLCARSAATSGVVGSLAYRLQKTYLPDYVLCNSDRSSMLNRVEMRTPYLDLPLVELLNSLPDDLKMRRLQLKHLLKRIAARYLPRELVHRPKLGFTVPIARFLREDLKDDLQECFGEGLLKRQGIFDPTHIRGLLERHFSGEDLYKPLWTLYCLQKWLLLNDAHA